MSILQQHLEYLRKEDEKQTKKRLRLEKIVDKQLLNAKCMLDSIVPARVEDYAKWLVSALEEGGKAITHHYDYNMPNTFYVAVKNFMVFPLYGAYSKHIIVPKHINVYWDNLGHNQLFLEMGYYAAGFWIPCFTDVAIACDKLIK